MLTSIGRTIAIATTLLFVSVLAQAQVSSQAEPSAHQIYQAASSGHLRQAEEMVEQVLRSHPNNGKAHYVAAEVYARAGDLARAQGELAAAERLQPGLPFANAGSVRELKAKLGFDSRHTAMADNAAGSRSFPWGWIALLGVAAAVIWAVMSRRRYANATYAPIPSTSGNTPVGPGAPYDGYGAAPGYGPGFGGGGGLGSRIAGGLATGLGVGAGVVAGEALAHHFLDRDQPPRLDDPGLPETTPSINADMGGPDFGLNSGEADVWGDDSGSSDFGGDGDWN